MKNVTCIINIIILHITTISRTCICSMPRQNKGAKGGGVGRKAKRRRHRESIISDLIDGILKLDRKRGSKSSAV